MARAWLIVAGLVIILGLALLALLWVLQRQLMYLPTTDVLPPEKTGLAGLEPIAFETSDGLRLNAWFVGVPGPGPPITILFFSGNAGNRSYRIPLAAALQRNGLQVLLVDYRGYGGNPGSPSASGLAIDSRAAREYLLGRPDVDASRIVYFGESLGTAVAVDLAAEHPPAALILRSPFTSMVDVARRLYPHLPVQQLLTDRYESLERMPRISAPLLVVAGGRDRIVPIDLTRRLYDAAVSPKTILVLPFADHNDYELLAGAEMLAAIDRLVQPLR